jgi:hypothetical protein
MGILPKIILGLYSKAVRENHKKGLFIGTIEKQR